MYIGAERDVWSRLGVTMLVGNGVRQSSLDFYLASAQSADDVITAVVLLYIVLLLYCISFYFYYAPAP